MAFLGGLMRGTSGAFLRGSLDTATDIIQANAVRDEEGIQSRVQGFGAKKKAYDDGINAYNAESKKIDNIAQALSVQDDEFIQNASQDELNSIARSLINLSGGKDPIDFYLNNRDKLSIKPLKSTAQTVVETPDMAQTEAALAAAEAPVKPDAGFDSFMGRLFGGANEEEIEQRAAKRLGMSIEQYRKVIAGTMPTRADPTAALAIDGAVVPGAGATQRTEQWDGSSWTEVADTSTVHYWGAAFGNTSGALVAGAYPAASHTDEWNGTAWAEAAAFSTSRVLHNAGTGGPGVEGGLIIGGVPSSAVTEEWTKAVAAVTMTSS